MMPNYNESLRTQIWVCESSNICATWTGGSVLSRESNIRPTVLPTFDIKDIFYKSYFDKDSFTILAMFSKKGSSKLLLGLSYKSWAVSQFMRCLLDYNFFSKFTNNFKCHARVSKTCRPWRPVSANFLWPVLIFGKSTRKNCAIMSLAHITYTIAH